MFWYCVLGVALALIALTAPAAAVPTGDPSLAVFGITLGSAQWNVPVVQSTLGGFMGLQYCYVAQLAYVYSGPGQPDTAYFQFTGANAVSETNNLIRDASSATNFAALQVYFLNKNLNLAALNVTYPRGTHSPSMTESGSWPAQHPEIIAGIAAGALVLVLVAVICWIQRRSKRQENLRETMEAMMGDDDVRAVARGETSVQAPSGQAAGKKRAPAASTAKAPRPGPGKQAPTGQSSAYAPPKSGQRERLVSFYKKYNPEKLTTVDATLSSYAGREEELFSALTTKYGPEPPAQHDDSISAMNGGHEHGSAVANADEQPTKGRETDHLPQQARSTSPEAPPQKETINTEEGNAPQAPNETHSVIVSDGATAQEGGKHNETTAGTSS